MSRLLRTALAASASLALASCCFVGAQPAATSGAQEAPAEPAEPAEAAWPAMPQPGPAPAFMPPSAVEAKLSNGLAVTLVQAGQVPLLSLRLNVYTGSADDPAGKAGTAAFTADLMNEATATRSALEISDQLQTLAATVGVSADTDFSHASLDCLEAKFDESLAILADVVRNPTFPEADVERVRGDRNNHLLTRRDQISSVAFDVYLKLLYGDQYIGRPTEGTVDSLAGITRDDLVAWHAAAWRPSNAGVVIVTRLGADTVLPILEKHLGDWAEPQGAAVAEQPVETNRHEGRTIYWVDRPGASQSYVLVGNTAPAFDPARQTARTLGNFPLGGQFTSRMNMNLREDKGYTYGARSRIISQGRGGFFGAWASVKAATTALSLTEFLTEIEAILGDKPASEVEFQKSQSSVLQGYAGRFEGIGKVLSQFASADANRRPAGWVAGFDERVSSVDRNAAAAALSETVDAAHLAIVIVGDWSVAGADVEALSVAPIVMLDEDGNAVEAE